MEENKRREIEEKLRGLLMAEKPVPSEKKQVKCRHSSTRVIRRRKGSPDTRIS